MSGSRGNGGETPLVVVVNGEAQVEYHRGRALAQKQRACLDGMDAQMAGGVQLGGEQVDSPDTLQKAQCVAIQLIEALKNGNDAMIAAGCAYLATRLPSLSQVRASLVDGGFSAELVFDEPFVKEVAVNFPTHRPS
jgi:hypothetical protein